MLGPSSDGTLKPRQQGKAVPGRNDIEQQNRHATSTSEDARGIAAGKNRFHLLQQAFSQDFSLAKQILRWVHESSGCLFGIQNTT